MQPRFQTPANIYNSLFLTYLHNNYVNHFIFYWILFFPFYLLHD